MRNETPKAPVHDIVSVDAVCEMKYFPACKVEVVHQHQNLSVVHIYQDNRMSRPQEEVPVITYNSDLRKPVYIND